MLGLPEDWAGGSRRVGWKTLGSRRPPVVRRYADLLLIPSVAAIAAAASLAVVSQTATFNQWLAVVLLVALTLHVLLLPTSWLPAMALSVHVLVPAPPIPILQAGITPSLAVLILSVWIVRRAVEQYRDGRQLVDWRSALLAGSLLVWMVLSTLFSGNPMASAGWVFTVVTSLVWFVVVPRTRDDVDHLLGTWVVVGVLITLHVSLETVVQSDLLYGWFYDQLGTPSIQHWSTYRPEGSFRHPLSAALFLAVSSIVALGEGVRRARVVYLVAAAWCGVGAVLTLSRGALIALVVGYLVVWLLWRPDRFRELSALRHLSGVAVAGGLLIALNAGPLASRLESAEATRSTDTRWDVLDVAWETTWAQGVFGAGPGLSQQASVPYNPGDLPIESSILQLLVSLGPIGLMLFLTAIVAVTVKAVRHGAVGAAAGMITFMVSVSFFNVMEQKESLIVFGGLLVLACRRPPDGSGVPRAALEGKTADGLGTAGNRVTRLI